MVQNFSCVFGTQSLDGTRLDGKQGHQMLPHLPKGIGVLSPTDTIVVFQNSLGEPGFAEFDVAGDSKT